MFALRTRQADSELEWPTGHEYRIRLLLPHYYTLLRHYYTLLLHYYLIITILLPYFYHITT